MSSVQFQAQMTVIRNDLTTYQVLVDRTISSQKEVSDTEVVVAAAATEKLWDPVNWTGFPISAFAFLAIKAEGTVGEFVDIEETVAEGDPNEELHTRRLFVGDVLVYFSKVAFKNHSASDAYAGTPAQIDLLRAKNPGANAITLRMILLDDS